MPRKHSGKRNNKTRTMYGVIVRGGMGGGNSAKWQDNEKQYPELPDKIDDRKVVNIRDDQERILWARKKRMCLRCTR